MCLLRGMAEALPDYEHFYQYATDQHNSSAQNVITEVPGCRKPVGIVTNDIEQLFAPRRTENERLVQKSLPNLQRSYGTIYANNSILSESQPLLRTKDGYQCHSSYLCGEQIELSRYRRTQIFLFFYIVFYVLYLIVGSVCLQKLETGIEQEIRDEFRDARRKFLAENPGVKGYFYVEVFFYNFGFSELNVELLCFWCDC